MMRSLFSTLTVVGVIVATPHFAKADAALDAILEKAIKAHGGADKLDKERASQSRAKGTLEANGMTLEINQESISFKGKFKETVSFSIGGNEVTVVAGFNGKDGFVTANGTEVPLTDEIKKELNEASHLISILKPTVLKDKKLVELKSLGEVKFDTKKLFGVKVTSKDHRDCEVYFDTETGLVTRVHRTVFDMAANKEVPEERIINEYQEVDGIKTPKKILINRDGKKHTELEVQEIKFLDKVEDSTFEKP
jgi:hypothetical protein